MHILQKSQNVKKAIEQTDRNTTQKDENLSHIHLCTWQFLVLQTFNTSNQLWKLRKHMQIIH